MWAASGFASRTLNYCAYRRIHWRRGAEGQTMTKRHFERFAELIKAQQGISSDTELRNFADIVACVAAENNPRFDRQRFLKACGF